MLSEARGKRVMKTEVFADFIGKVSIILGFTEWIG